MDDMISYNNDDIERYDIPTDFTELGVVNMTRLNGSIPFYIFQLVTGQYLKKFD